MHILVVTWIIMAIILWFEWRTGVLRSTYRPRVTKRTEAEIRESMERYDRDMEAYEKRKDDERIKKAARDKEWEEYWKNGKPSDLPPGAEDNPGYLKLHRQLYGHAETPSTDKGEQDG